MAFFAFRFSFFLAALDFAAALAAVSAATPHKASLTMILLIRSLAVLKRQGAEPRRWGCLTRVIHAWDLWSALHSLQQHAQLFICSK